MPVTLHLATHRSGLPRIPGNLDAGNLDDPSADYGWDDLVAFLESHDLQRSPGESFEYSILRVVPAENLVRAHAGGGS
jgi:serine-type D-Ala-D-Ala carboxypeptidase/endopeptidase